MAARSSENFAEAFSEGKDVFNFEKLFKKAAKKNYKEWSDKEQADSKLDKLVRILHYWKKKLEEALTPQTIILTLYNEGLDPYIDLDLILAEIGKLNMLDKVIGYFKPRNKRLIGLEFSTEEDKNFVLNNLKMVGDHFVVFMDWLEINKDIMVKLHWLPCNIDLNRIQQSLAKYGDIESIKREEVTTMNGFRLKSGIVHVNLILHKNLSINSIPHLIYIGSLQSLVTIRGRVAMCLSCEKLGHIASSCPYQYCKLCKFHMIKGHECENIQKVKSYAQVTNSNLNEWEQMEVLDDVDNVNLIPIVKGNKEVSKTDSSNIFEDSEEFRKSTNLDNKMVSHNINYKEDFTRLDNVHTNIVNQVALPSASSVEVKEVNGSIIYDKENKLTQKTKFHQLECIDEEGHHQASKKNKIMLVKSFNEHSEAAKVFKTYGAPNKGTSNIQLSNTFDLLSESDDKWSSSEYFKDSEDKPNNVEKI